MPGRDGAHAGHRTRGRFGLDPVLAAHVVIACLVVGALAAGVPDRMVDHARLNWLTSVLFNVSAFASTSAIIRLLPRDDPARRFFQALRFAVVMIFLAQCTQLIRNVRGPHTSDALLGGPVPTALVGCGVIAVVIVTCTYPLQTRSRREYFCYWLDMATVLVGAAAYGWYFANPSAARGGAVTEVLSGPGVLLVAVFALAKLLLAGRPPFGAVAGLLGICAALSGAVASGVGPALYAQGHGNWYFVANTIGDVFLALAVLVQRRRVTADPAGAGARGRRPFTTLPYFAVGATFTLLAAALTRYGLDGRAWVVLGGAAVSTGLVVVRQLASFADNARLLAELDRKVDELHAVIQERDVLAAQLRQLAYHDNLTGLANRAMFNDRLAATLARVRRGHAGAAVLLLDLDDFKPINDRYGHAAGDAVLKEVGLRLRACLREIDTPARLGGDEFAVLLAEPPPDGVSAIVERIRDAVRQPCVVDGGQVRVGVSIGVAYPSADCHDIDELLRVADIAMYDAKCRTKGIGSPAGARPAPAPYPCPA